MFLLHKKLDVNVGTKVTGIFPSAILLANGCKWLRIQVNVPATDCLGRDPDGCTNNVDSQKFGQSSHWDKLL
jgi:hypothetical protein